MRKNRPSSVVGFVDLLRDLCCVLIGIVIRSGFSHLTRPASTSAAARAAADELSKLSKTLPKHLGKQHQADSSDAHDQCHDGDDGK